MARSLSRFALLVFLVVGLFGCDHATKMAAKATLENAAAVPLAPALELRYVENTDIAFNAFGHLGLPRSPAIFAVLGIFALGLIVLLALRGAKDAHAEARPLAFKVGVALVLGGALGNLVDRIARGYVVDFIHVSGWPIFNVADIAVVAGGLLLALVGMRSLRPSRTT